MRRISKFLAFRRSVYADRAEVYPKGSRSPAADAGERHDYVQKENMNITHIDHIVLTVNDIDVSIQFYESVLGMVSERFGEGRVALKFGNQKINLHKYGHEFEPKANQPVPGSADLCLITEMELGAAMEHIKSKGIDILEGPVARTGATGSIISFYFRDPDGNLLEVANYVKST